MGSRREEERNEKIIRGLMKLPPNRKCINCNSLGPQYVCTNFWTFVCMTCSGIHREFTHRVKSVSMSKFTSQEVEALQNGGNQRARELYLKNWDPHNQRLPSSSNVDRIRDFIKSVYVDKRYIVGKASDNPPGDMQSPKSSEDEMRRASSYHSFSQSPPYDYQYEERRNRKQSAMLSRRPGSDRGYAGKFSNFFYSPGHSSQKMSDRFANDGSSSRVSDYSVSSGGDPFRSEGESPNFQKDSVLSSPAVHSRNMSVEDMSRCTVPRPQRTTSLGSFSSFDSNSTSFKSFNSASLADVSESGQTVGTHQDKATTSQQILKSENSVIPTPLQTPGVSALMNTTSTPIDLFQLPSQSAAASVDLFEPSPPLSVSASTSATDLFADFGQQQFTETTSKELSSSSVAMNMGWANFESSQSSVSASVTENLAATNIGFDNVGPSAKLDSFSFSNENLHWPPYQNPSSDKFSQLASDSWDDKFHNVQAPSVATISQSWNTFEDPVETFHTEDSKKMSGSQLAANMVLPWDNIEESSGYPAYDGLEENRKPQDSDKEAVEACLEGQPSGSGLPRHLATPSYSAQSPLGEVHSHTINSKPVNPFDLPLEASISVFGLNNMSHDTAGLSFPPSMLPVPAEVQSSPADCKSTNPFDLPFDSTLEQSEMYFDMHSMQAALPDPQLSFLGGDSQQWFPQNSVTSYVPATSHGGLAYMAGQPPGTQLP